jgi:hypothetical protein
MTGRGQTVPAGARFIRALNATLALLYLATAGLVAYLRLGPVQRVMERLERDGASIPTWFPVVSTAAPLIIGVISSSGRRYLRRAIAAPPGPRGDWPRPQG